MNQQMWAAAAVTDNMQLLLSRGVVQIGPVAGEQACGDVGYGRMAEPLEIVEAVASYYAINQVDAEAHQNACSQPKVLAGMRILITAGPTREAIDPVRYISNHSSGKMGFAIAKAAVELGAEVILVAGPVTLSSPENVTRHDVVSAQEMLDCVEKHVANCDVFIACAAVADYKVMQENPHKLKKKAEELSITFTQNPDILKTVAMRKDAPFTLGFAAETQDLEAHARAKLEKKHINMIAANDVSSPGLGFDSDNNALMVISRNMTHQLAPATKDALALELLLLMHEEYKQTTKVR
jgi:phosphopantothenoylcysteine decarboxylase/phosphopantothenate--cysteine ligase